MGLDIAGGASGAAAGASAGSTFGLYGAAIGAVAGGVFGAVQGGAAKEKEAAARQAQQKKAGEIAARNKALQEKQNKELFAKGKRQAAIAEVTAAGSGAGAGSSALNATNSSLFQVGERISFLDALDAVNSSISEKDVEAGNLLKQASDIRTTTAAVNAGLNAFGSLDLSSKGLFGGGADGGGDAAADGGTE